MKQQPSGIQPHYVSVKDAALYLACSTAKVYLLLDAKAIESRYMGTRRLVVRSSLEEYAESLPESSPAVAS